MGNDTKNRPDMAAECQIDAGLSGSATADCMIPLERYRVFIEDIGDGFYETNIKGDFIFFNDALCRIFGYPPEEVQGRNYAEFMDPDHTAAAFSDFNAIFKTGIQSSDIVWQIRRKDGETRILAISASLIINAAGRRTGFRGVARDVTDKHRAQQELEKSRQRAEEQYRASRRAELKYRNFLNFLPVPVFVFNMDSTVSYLNPAFEKVFGWTLSELKGKRIPFVPDDLKAETRRGVKKFFKEKKLENFETRRLTKDGRLLDIILDGALFYDEAGNPAGQVIMLRDITRERRLDRSNQTLLRISKALHKLRTLDERLKYITREIKQLVGAAGASVILLDEEKQEFFFRVTAYDDQATGKRMREIRFPASKGVAGAVYQSGEPLIVPDTSESEFFFKTVDGEANFETKSMVDVPLWQEDRMIGVLCAVNKKHGTFDQTDVEMLTTIAGMVAMPIENARINDELKRSYDEVTTFNRAKERVIHHLSHELKTPVSVLAAAFELIRKRCLRSESGAGIIRILDRAQRNLGRILDMQYQTEDIIKQRDYTAHQLLSTLLDACEDELSVLLLEAQDEGRTLESVRRKVDELFGPRKATAEQIVLGSYVEGALADLAPHFAHRACDIATTIQSDATILIPPDVLRKIVTGLVRNAIEYTPDGGQLEVTVRDSQTGVLLEVRDTGTGITADNQRLLFENYFTPPETMHYSSKKPFDFNAGGKGFDLLRMKIFSERYGFDLALTSQRCPYLEDTDSLCPGNTDGCAHCRPESGCRESGGTTVRVLFSRYAEY
ncbi:MAG: Serine phosphatase RsbU, regulator of sigma subunit [Olavius algarvensis Delta 4 endosymbiont]|nr:MAG: Serine phosphatase RsbU, regulator of sigma subunit [Olavius algarvensis Delta 4 endosymbiont]